MDKEALFRPRLEQADVEIPGVGTVTVRALTRWELLTAGHGVKEGNVLELERRMLAYGMVEPALTESEVGEWQKVCPANEIQPILAKINELSGVGKDAHKEAYKSLRPEPGP